MAVNITELVQTINVLLLYPQAARHSSYVMESELYICLHYIKPLLRKIVVCSLICILM